MTIWSKSAVDQLGRRLVQDLTADDLARLDDYRRTFGSDYDDVMHAMREVLGIEVSGRPAKSTSAIVDKLRRGTMRLSQMQDIAGCRTVVPESAAQQRLVERIQSAFPSIIDDRTARPSHGYRAVHVIAKPRNLPIEIQVRTRLQHQWAEVSEKFADAYGMDVKYGGGPGNIREVLDSISELIADLEEFERTAVAHQETSADETRRVESVKTRVAQALRELASVADNAKESP